MNKTLNINLGGFIFHIDEDAYHKLERYLSILKAQFSRAEGGAEIIKDIEIRIAELFKERTSESKEVISVSDVEEVISIMGKPEDYLDGEEEPAPQPNYNYSSNHKRNRRIFRDPDDKIFGGVASGLAAYFNVDPIWMRVLFVVLAFGGFSLLFYVILWVVIPKAKTTAEKLQMRGERVNISNIERSVKEELGGFGENVKNFTKRATEYDYSRPANHATNIVRDIVDFLINAIKLVFSFAFKLMGLGFLALGFIALFAVVIGLFSGGFQIIDGGYNFYDLYEFLELVTTNSAHLNMLTLGVFLLILAPLVLIIYLGVRIVFKLDPLGSPARRGLTGLAVIGFVLVIISGIRIALEFDNSSYYTENIKVETKSDILYLDIRKSNVYDLYEENRFNGDWLQTPDGNAFKAVDLEIEPTDEKVAFIKKTVRSQGNKRRSARDHAKSANYKLNQNDSLIEFDIHYLIAKDEKFRGQEVSLTLYLPVGKSIYLNEKMVDIIYDIDNVNGYWDFDMVDHTWKMTKKGLKCMDCPNSNNDFEEEEEEVPNQEFEETEVEIKEEEKEVPLELAQAENPMETRSYWVGNLNTYFSKV